MSRKRMKSKSRLKKTFLISGIVIGVLIIAVCGYGYYLYLSASNTANKMYTPLKGDNSHDLPLKQTNTTAPPINILLLGVDEREGDKGRSDTMIVATLNPKTDSMLMTSIPRDTRVELPGRSDEIQDNAKLFKAFSKRGKALPP